MPYVRKKTPNTYVDAGVSNQTRTDVIHHGYRGMRQRLDRRWAFAAAICLLPGRTEAGPSTAVVTGGADTSGHNYEWTITNHYTAAVIAVEFRHYGASLFVAPDGWDADCAKLVNVGVRDPAGTCTASAEPDSGIRPGRSGTFRLQVAHDSARRGTGAVLLRYADGTDVTIGGVELPTPESLTDQYVPLLGLGVVFLLVIAARERRARKARIHAAQVGE